MAASRSAIAAPDIGEAEWRGERERVDAALAALCDRHLPVIQPAVAQAVRYSMLGGGKRLRPLLLLAAYRATGGTDDASTLAAAVEVVHAYSLVHDDLPCMDDDAVRRGRPTTHRVYGAAVATAAGVAMVPLAVRCAIDGAATLGLPGSACADIVRELMRASGAGGMVGGQLLDLFGEGRALSLAELEHIHRAKTGALIEACVRIGGIAARTDEPRSRALAGYGAALGLAFQIADDVLDATATTDQLGKTAGRDAVLGKSTYPAHLGIDGAIERASALADQACRVLEEAGILTPELQQLARYCVARRS